MDYIHSNNKMDDELRYGRGHDLEVKDEVFSIWIEKHKGIIGMASPLGCITGYTMKKRLLLRRLHVAPRKDLGSVVHLGTIG